MGPGQTVDWQAWHKPYADPSSPLSARLRLVQQRIDAWLDERAGAPSRVVSVCAGDGRDLLEVLAARGNRDRVVASLVELDHVLAATARRQGLRLTDPVRVHVVEGDAGSSTSYTGLTPADLVLLCGVFGNISDEDVQRTIEALPELCSTGATVAWTRSRREPDLTPAIREWFSHNDFHELAFHAPQDVLFTVGVHRFAGTPRPLQPGQRLFTFVR